MSGRTLGQIQALDELGRIIKVSADGIGMAEEPRLLEDGTTLRVDVWIEVTDAFSDEDGGRALQRREQVELYIPAEFPFQPPTVRVSHSGFAGLPHVQWGHYLCLYASANDWDPSEGMWGFFNRLLTWYARAVRGQLSDPALPWHPPVTYRWRDGGVLIMRAELPDEYEKNDAIWTCWAIVTPLGSDRFELLQWAPVNSADINSQAESLQQRLVQTHRNGTDSFFTAPVVALPQSLGFEYPVTVGELTGAMIDHGVDVSMCNDLLERTWAVNRAVTSHHPTHNTIPLMLLIGSPAADRASAPSRIAHLAAWRIPYTATNPISDTTLIDWIKVYDQRQQSTTRRDASRPVQWLSGRRVIILGCGALGAPIAEHCVRAGVHALTIIDNGNVNPGILVRQPYQYADIGSSKANVLRERLSAIAPHTAVTSQSDNALSIITDELPLFSADLIVDATADRSVAAKLERLWRTSQKPVPPILSVMVGHRSEHGLGTLALPGSTGAGADILRRFAIAASFDAELTDVLDDFYPDPPRTDLFQPEPGCSDPTFVGSAADLAILAAQLLNSALTVLNFASNTAQAMLQPRRSAIVARLPSGLHPQAANGCLQWSNDFVQDDDVNNYQIRIDPAALAEMRREVLRAAAANSRDETGGVLLGQVDHGCRVVWVSEARGLPPNSAASPGGLWLDVRGLGGELAERRRSSRGMVSFIGAWHSHPNGPVKASDRDRETMGDLVNGEEETLSQALLVVVGGTDGRWQEWVNGNGRPDMHVEMFFPSPQGT